MEHLWRHGEASRAILGILLGHPEVYGSFLESILSETDTSRGAPSRSMGSGHKREGVNHSPKGMNGVEENAF